MWRDVLPCYPCDRLRCGYSRGHIEPHAAQECTVHVATQRGRAKRLQHRHPPGVQPAAPMRECPCRRPRLPPRRGTAEAPSREQGHPGGAHGRRHDPSASPCHGRRCPPVSLLFASWPWLLHTGCSLQTIDMTVHERNYERRYSRFMIGARNDPRRVRGRHLRNVRRLPCSHASHPWSGELFHPSMRKAY